MFGKREYHQQGDSWGKGTGSKKISKEKHQKVHILNGQGPKHSPSARHAISITTGIHTLNAYIMSFVH